MDDTAQNSNVTDIWSTAGQGNQQDDQSQPVPQGSAPAPAGGSFGKPGLAGGGENRYSEDKQEGGERVQKTEAEEKSRGLEADRETLDLLEKARKREMEELAELRQPAEQQRPSENQRPTESHKYEERQKIGEVQKPQETLTSPEVGRSPEVPRNPEMSKSPEVQKSPEIGQSPEIPRSPEVQKSPEIHRPGVDKQQKESTDQPVQKVPAPPVSEKILDKRTGKEKTHRVDINKADAVTKVADIKEQEFIERVEQEHVKSII